MPQIVRHQIADYLGIRTVAAGVTTTTFYLMGTGFTKIDEDPKAVVHTSGYVSDKNKSSSITGYDRTFPFDFEFIKAQEAVDALVAVAHDDKIGADAEFDFIRVDLYEAGDATGAYRARKWAVCAEISSITGEPQGVVKGSGVLHTVGDAIPGEFVVSTKVFTPDA